MPERGAFAEPALHECERDAEQVEMQRGDDEEPAERPPVAPHETPVIAQRPSERFAVKDERDLHRREDEQDPREHRARDLPAEIERRFLLRETTTGRARSFSG